MDGLQVRLFGEVSIRQNGHPLPSPAGKAFELFCYLLLHRDRAHTREILSEVLWPGGKPASSRRYLRQALWRLSAAVQYRPDNDGKGSELLLIGDHGWVRINPSVPCWLDVDEFERIYAGTRDLPGQLLSDGQAHDLEVALDLYQGELLATWYQDWCSYERDRLQLVHLAMLDQLMGHCEARQRYAKGLSLGQVVLRCDPARESTHRQLMRLYYRSGDRISAIRQYERCASVMTQDLGIRPSADTVVLYEQIRADRVLDIPVHPVAGQSATGRSPARPETAALADLRVRLDQIQASLLALHRCVLQDGGARFGHTRVSPNGSPGTEEWTTGVTVAENGP